MGTTSLGIQRANGMMPRHRHTTAKTSRHPKLKFSARSSIMGMLRFTRSRRV